IARPITKGKLFLSRFVGISVSFLAGILISLGIADVLLNHYIGSFMSSSLFTDMLAGYLIEAIAFSGIIFLVSQFLKSQGAILGVGIAMLFILGFMWTTISEIFIYLLKVSTTSPAYLKDLLIINSISPSYFPTIISDYYTGAFRDASAASVGINIFSVVIIGLIWLLVPAGIALYRTRISD
ncbi:MAG: ABC transporter permease subunit, partial [Ferroplasma sp.]